MMSEGKVVFNIQILDNGEQVVTTAEGRTIPELPPEELGKSLNGKTIRNAKVLPPITLLESNPRWVCVGGRWYYIP